MQPTNFSKNKSYFRSPSWAQGLKSLVSRIDRMFGIAFRSYYNPFAQSGVVAVSLFLILIITGLALILFYRLGTPYESMVTIQENVWLGRWLRSVHRYATDLGIVFIGFHVFRMFSQGKTWGPRALAWLSGVFMLGMYFISAMTGFILVWDSFALKVANAWATLVDTLPILPAPLARALSGDVTLGTSFFFMNLFLHVALPLGIVGALWLHTSKLKDAKWAPPKHIIGFIFISLILYSVFVPAPLNPAANLLLVKGAVIDDIWFSWWIIIKDFLGNFWMWIAIVIFFGLMFAIPWVWRPQKNLEPGPSLHDEASCEGCTQCVKDCPFDAISMVPRTIGEGSEMVANVSAKDCVSCGICSGSCSQFAIGPAGRTGRDQLAKMKSIFSIDTEMKTPVLFCRNRTRGSEEGKYLDPKYLTSEVDCIGSIHPGVITMLLGHHSQVVLAACEPGCCEMRLGGEIEWQRLYDNREPALPSRVNRGSIIWDQKASPSFRKAWFPITVSTFILFAVIGLGSAVTIGSAGKSSYLRLAWRFPIQKIETCRTLSEEELKSRPVHMRVLKECKKEILPVRLTLKVDSKVVLDRNIVPAGMREDRPLLVEEELLVEPGIHDVQITFEALNSSNQKPLEATFNAKFENGFARLVTVQAVPNQPDERMFVLK